MESTVAGPAITRLVVPIWQAELNAARAEHESLTEKVAAAEREAEQHRAAALELRKRQRAMARKQAMAQQEQLAHKQLTLRVRTLTEGLRIATQARTPPLLL